MTDHQSESTRYKKRAGGRRGRKTARSKGTRGQVVYPGMSGGQYKPLSEQDIQRIYNTALDLLENVGIGDPIEEVLRYALPGGCTLDADNRLRFPRSLVEDLIAISAKGYINYAPDPANDLEIKDSNVFYCTSGEATSILDYKTQAYKPTRLVDLYDAARLADQLEHIHSFGQPFIAAEYSHDVYLHDINIAYAELAGTNKSFSLGIANVEHIDPIISLFDTYLGEEGGFCKTTLLYNRWMSNCLTTTFWC